MYPNHVCNFPDSAVEEKGMAAKKQPPRLRVFFIAGSSYHIESFDYRRIAHGNRR